MDWQDCILHTTIWLFVNQGALLEYEVVRSSILSVFSVRQAIDPITEFHTKLSRLILQCLCQNVIVANKFTLWKMFWNVDSIPHWDSVIQWQCTSVVLQLWLIWGRYSSHGTKIWSSLSFSYWNNFHRKYFEHHVIFPFNLVSKSSAIL